jgi:protein SCO1
MGRKLLFYGIFFVVLITGFLFFVFKDEDLTKSLLPVINAEVPDFSFTNQDGKAITQNNIEDKVYVAEYFFTTCKGICPKMNANMRRVYDMYKEEPGFLILSHTCMPETDSIPLLKAYEEKMVNGKLVKNADGSYKILYDTTTNHKPQTPNPNWNFLTGDKTALYKIARQGYMIDNNKPDPSQKMADQFIHTQFFALVDKQRRLRGIYDGLKEDEIQKLLKDIKGLLKEKVTSKHFVDGFNNNPN